MKKLKADQRLRSKRVLLLCENARLAGFLAEFYSARDVVGRVTAFKKSISQASRVTTIRRTPATLFKLGGKLDKRRLRRHYRKMKGVVVSVGGM